MVQRQSNFARTNNTPYPTSTYLIVTERRLRPPSGGIFKTVAPIGKWYIELVSI